jgi:glycosyltransferase involved in cell wall biosynthesis
MDGPFIDDIETAFVQFNLASLWQNKGKFDRAIAGFQEALRIQPGYLPAHLELSNLFLLQGKIDMAIDACRRAIELNPGEACLRSNLTDLLAQKSEQQSGKIDGSSELLPETGEAAGLAPGHVLLYTDCSGVYGAEQCSHSLMVALSASGYRVTCAQEKNSNHLVVQRKQAGIRHVWLRKDDIYAVSGTPRALTVFSEAQTIFAAVRPDLIVFADGCPVSNLTAKQVAGQLGIPYIIIIHGVLSEWAKQFAPHLNKLPAIFHKAKAVITISRESLRLLRQAFGLPKTSGQVIHNGRPDCFFTASDPSARRRIRESLEIPLDAVVCTTVARISTSKGFQYLLKSFGQLSKSAAWEKLFFIWAGSGAIEPQLRALSMQLGAAGRIRFAGVRQDIPELLDASDIFILPSEFEGMPLSVMEAMAKGVPVIATSVGGMPEELGETGKLLPDPRISPEETVRDLAATIEAWTSEPKLRSDAGNECRKRAEKMFREGRMVREYMDIIARMLPSEMKAAGPRVCL